MDSASHLDLVYRFVMSNFGLSTEFCFVGILVLDLLFFMPSASEARREPYRGEAMQQEWPFGSMTHAMVFPREPSAIVCQSFYRTSTQRPW